MYGLLLENLSEYVKTVFGDEKWDEIRRQAGIASPSFGVHDDYDEDLLNHLATTAQQVSFWYFYNILLLELRAELFLGKWKLKMTGNIKSRLYGTSCDEQ